MLLKGASGAAFAFPPGEIWPQRAFRSFWTCAARFLTFPREGVRATMGLMPEAAGLTYADLFAFPDDGVRRELLDGELLVSPSPRRRHQELLGRLYLAIGNHLSVHPVGRVFLAPFDVVFTQRTVLEPDLVFIAESRLEILTEANIQGVPSLVIEILSEPRRDRVLKHEAYARHGVPEYWIVDPDSDWVEIYRLGQDQRYGKPEILRPNEVLSTDLIPGLQIELRELFRPD